jgi:hypothetical protein
VVCPGEIIDFYHEEEPPVTLQVGMIANNGIVLAGDIWRYMNADANRPGSVWSADMSSKITIFENKNMAITRAHDLAQARLVSDAIAGELSSEHWRNPERTIEEIATAALATQPIWRGLQCLIVLGPPSLSLFKVQCATDPETQAKVCTCERSGGLSFAGDCHNPATFWATRYFVPNQARAWTIDELLPLATQIVVDASFITSGSIRALEVVRCDGDGFHQIETERCRVWADEAIRRSGEIERHVFAPLSTS